MNKKNFPANFLLLPQKGSINITCDDKPTVSFKANENTKTIDIIEIPLKLSKKYGIIKKLRDARILAKSLKEEKVTLDIKHEGKLVLRLGEKAKPKFSKIITLSKDIEIKDLKRLQSLEKSL